jgi:hypothetical protein
VWVVFNRECQPPQEGRFSKPALPDYDLVLRRTSRLYAPQIVQ